MADFRSIVPTNAMNLYDSIPEFYAGKSVFITGGTGFVGKVLIEKLLYSCPQIDRVFILIKEKKNISPENRMKTIFDLPMFTRLKKVRPNDINKVVPIVGDLSLPNLGIQGEDEQMLIKKVSVVFHVAATVRFDEPLKVAMNINYEGTRRILDLSRRMEILQVFVHVSTAYSNSEHKVVEEKIYPISFTSEDVYTAIKQQENDRNDTRIKEILGGRPNTYTLTKALAESLVNEQHGRVPAIIIRPSIVTASVSEPLPGWVDNRNGATAIITTIAKGLNRVVLSNRSGISDFIPVDYVSNFTIVAAARCPRPERATETTVYNICSSAVNPLQFGTLCDTVADESVKNNFYELLRPTLIFTRSKLVLTLLTFLLQTLPAFILDCWLRFRGEKPRFMKMQEHVFAVQTALQYFTSNSWVMKCERSRSLYESLCMSDQLLFPFDPVNIDWDTYIRSYSAGIRKYLFK